jgi:hypothetical protein
VQNPLVRYNESLQRWQSPATPARYWQAKQPPSHVQDVEEPDNAPFMQIAVVVVVVSAEVVLVSLALVGIVVAVAVAVVGVVGAGPQHIHPYRVQVTAYWPGQSFVHTPLIIYNRFEHCKQRPERPSRYSQLIQP